MTDGWSFSEMDHFLKILNFFFGGGVDCGIIMGCIGSRFLNRLNTEMHISVAPLRFTASKAEFAG